MYAQVQVTAAQKDAAVLVPREAVVQQADGSTVFVAAGGKAEARKVQVGLSDDTYMEIVSGVNAGEPVIVQGQNSLKDGQAVVVPGASQERGGSSEGGAREGGAREGGARGGQSEGGAR
jgi:multidrug efflux pump subunit AcrA (membrane-fusion protein)